MDDKARKVFVAIGMGMGVYFFYKLLKGSSVKKAAADTIQNPLEIVKDTADSVMQVSKTGLKYFAKGTKQAKEYMAKLRGMKKDPKSKSKKK